VLLLFFLAMMMGESKRYIGREGDQFKIKTPLLDTCLMDSLVACIKGDEVYPTATLTTTHRA
jgi:hypothetical protein